jgi:uncharacterized protein (TIGR00369 family)
VGVEATGSPVSAETDQLVDRLGIVVLEANSRRVVATMPAHGNRQAFGLIHGGAYCALGETVGSIAANLHAGPDAYAVGIDLNATHHLSVREGTVTATASALALGQTLCSHQIEIRDERSRLVSTVRITNLIRRTGEELPSF